MATKSLVGRELLDVHWESSSSTFVTAGRAVQLWDSREKACTARIDLAAQASRFNPHNPSQLAIGTKGAPLFLSAHLFLLSHSRSLPQSLCLFGKLVVFYSWWRAVIRLSLVVPAREFRCPRRCSDSPGV